MQKVLNVLVIVIVLANLAFTGYIYSELQKKSEEFQSILDGPFKLPGQGLSAYDLSSPESSLRSYKAGIEAFDLRAGIDLLKLSLRSENSAFLNFLLEKDAELEVVKTHLIKNSSVDDAEGKVLAFIRVTANGVESRDVIPFEKTDGMLLNSSFYLSEYSKENWTEEDEYLYRVEKSWKTTGKL